MTPRFLPYKPPDSTKLQQLILHIAQQCSDDPYFGMIKLNKLLFFCDFNHYRETGRSITGWTYAKLPHGPAADHYQAVIDDMKAIGSLAVQPEDRYGNAMHRPVPLRRPDLTQFTAPEIALVDNVVSRFCGHNASNIEKESHDFIGWKVAKIGDVISYCTAFVGTASDPLDHKSEPLPEIFEYGMQLEAELVEAS